MTDELEIKATPNTDLSGLSEDAILKLRMCDLDLSIKGTYLEEYISELYKELDLKNLKFHPVCYLADEWMVPENEPVVGIAFFLAHPALKNIEQKMMHEVEGGDKVSFMKLLRHETGHAVNYAYQFYKRKKWQQLFGHFSTDYPDRYKYRAYSKSFVLHLEEWYAQYHPDEDFAETFAVWLNPQSDWQNKYKGWKALEKLQYVDQLIKEAANKPPIKKTGKKLWNISGIKMSLKTHYKRKMEFYAEYAPTFHDFHLKIIFPQDSAEHANKAYKVIYKYRKEILKHISFWTGEKKYIIDRLIKNLIKRCKELNLRTGPNETNSILKITTYITALIMNYIHTGRFKREKGKTG